MMPLQWHPAELIRSRVGPVVVLVLVTLGAALQGRAAPTHAQPAGPAASEPSLPSCDPRILYSRFGSGVTEATGAGVATTPSLEFRDGPDTLVTSATITWSFRAFVREPRGQAPLSHTIGGFLNLEIVTGAGHQIRFRAHCIAGAGTFRLPPSLFTEGYTLLLGNGTVTGWPSSLTSPQQGVGARPTFVHFEAARNPFAGGQIEIYVALVDGKDCAVNHQQFIWTPNNALGAGSYRATNRTSYTETDCSLLGGPGRSLPRAPRGP